MISDAILFYSLIAVVLLCGLFVVASRNLVHAAFWLMPCFLGVACLFLLLDNDLLFAVQLLIYAGAVPILILFVLMLVREVMSEGRRETGRLWPLALVAALLFLTLAVPIVRSVPEPSELPPVPGDIPRKVGEGFLTLYVLPFELASVLLLGALVGAVYLARKDETKEARPAPAVRTETNGSDTSPVLADRGDAAV